MIALEYNNTTQLADLVRDGGNLGIDEGLDTSVLVSLFTRRRALPDDVLPEPLGTRAGWWGDRYPDIEGDLIGSRLWLLSRSKTTQQVMNQAKVYAEEALQWMIDDGIASEITVIVERISSSILAFQVSIMRPEEVSPRWERTWQAHLDQL